MARTPTNSTVRKKQTKATKKKPRKSKKVSVKFQPQKIWDFFKDERVKIVSGIFLIFVSLFLCLAFFSYFSTWQADQSVVRLGFWPMLRSLEDVENMTGKLGAWFSDLFIHRWFGIPSIGFIFLLALAGFRLIKVKLLHFGKSLRYTVLLIIWFSIALAYLFEDDYFFVGGAHGYVMSNYLKETLGKAGTAFLLIVAIFTFLLFAFENSLIFIRNTIKSSKDLKGQYAKQIENFAKSVERGGTIVEKNAKDLVKSIKKQETVSKDEHSEKHNYILSDDGKTQLPKEEESKTGDNGQEVESDDGQSIAIEVEENKELSAEKIQFKPPQNYDPKLDLPHYKSPPVDLLVDHTIGNPEVSNEELLANKNRIVETLRHYKIEIEKIKATIGPTITLYEIVPQPGIRISKIKNLEDDIALSLSALGIRIIAPMPGRGTIGIEVPNQKPEIVSMRAIIESKRYQESKLELPVALGKTISNETYIFDLVKMPHLLVAGATGQGKSVGLNAILTSILYKKHPAEVKFVLIDPKKVELNIYEVIEKHFLAKLPDSEEAIITDNTKVIHTLSSLNVEMDARYQLLKSAHVRNIKEYNAKFIARRLNPEKGHRFMPYIVLVIDEFADLIMTTGKEVELPIARLAQLARAIGIHLIVATQRPSTNIITGVIKANFPGRVAFKVASMIDSRTILDSPGANQLIGRGDMLITKGSELIRVQCAFVDTPEIDEIVKFIGEQQGYTEAHILPEYVDDSEDGKPDVDLQQRDKLFEEAARIVVANQQGSTSLIQRKLSIGYNRAGRIMDQLEAAGIVGPPEGSKPRQVFYMDELSLEQLISTFEQ